MLNMMCFSDLIVFTTIIKLYKPLTGSQSIARAHARSKRAISPLHPPPLRPINASCNEVYAWHGCNTEAVFD